MLAAACALTTAACSGAGASGVASSSSAAASASAGASSSLSGTYLALGDSVPFGYRGGQSGADYTKATNFTGYPELVGRKLGLHVLNTSCPGETTASFSDVTAQSNGCENALQTAAGYRTAFPLHVSYDSPNQSQMDLAVAILKRTKNVSLVTLQIGANDGFVCQQTTADQCVSEFGTVAQTAATNIGRILTALRTEGGYRGKVVLVTYYAVSYVGGAAGLEPDPRRGDHPGGLGCRRHRGRRLRRVPTGGAEVGRRSGGRRPGHPR